MKLLIAVLLVGLCSVFNAAAQAPNSTWVYPSSSGDLLYQFDERGQRIADFSDCGYRSGAVPLPNVSAQIAQNRWVNVSPGAGDDTALIQAAIDTVSAMTPDANGWRGVVYLNAGEYQIGTSGSLSGVAVTHGGSGYTSAPVVTVTGGGGSGATATATITSGAVTALNITNSGSGYTSNPAIAFSGGGGSGAAASPTLSGLTAMRINASGVVLKGAGDDPATGTRLRATSRMQYTLISAAGSGSRSTVSNTTRNLTQTLVPAGTRTFQVDSTSGLAAGHTVIIKRPSTAEWIADIDMDQLGPGSPGGESDDVPWTPGSKDLLFDRVITRIDGNWITVDAPLPQSFEAKYGGGQIWRYTWSGRIEQVGIEDLNGFSDYTGSTDEAHAWSFIDMNRIQHGWVRNITARHFGYAAVKLDTGAKWITVADSECLDAISIITGSRRYSFNNEGAELTLFQNNYARSGRHDFVMGSIVRGPNAFIQSKADTVYSDTGPHHRWAAGGLFDNITVNGNEINVQNRGNFGTGHGWAGAYMAVWNSTANNFRVRNPPTARNWLVGSVGNILASAAPVGADPPGTYDSSGPSGTGKAVYPQSLYHGQLQQRLKWPDSQFRESWLGDVDQFTSTGGTGETVNCNAAWLAQVQVLGASDSKFDFLSGNRNTAFTFDFTLDPGDAVVAASITVSLRDVGSASGDDVIFLDTTSNPQTYASLGWTPVASIGSTVRTISVDPALLADGRLNVALGADSAVDFAALHFQVQKAQPATTDVTFYPEADSYVQGGTNAAINFGTATTLQTKDITSSNVNRDTFIRWDLGGVTGKLVKARVRLGGTSASQTGSQSGASFVADDTWDEAVVTFNNKPAAGTLFAQWLPVTGQAVEFSVTPQVTDTLLGDLKLSLRVASTGDYGAAGNVTYASRESATLGNRPQLILTFENTAPTITDVPDQTINEDAATAPLAFTIGDDLTAPGSLVVTGVSSDSTLVPNSNIVISGADANRSVTVTPAPNQSGSATITLTVSDGSLTAEDTFVLTVNPVDDPPVANPGTTTTLVNEPVEIDLRTLVSDLETPLSGLRFSVSDGVNGTVVLLADGYTVRFTPTGNFSGAASFSYTVTDSTADSRIFLNYTFQPPDGVTDGLSTDVSGNGRDATITNVGNGSASYVVDGPAALAPALTQSVALTENGSAGASRLQRTISPTAELDFKTADWTVAGWVKRTEAVDQDIIFHLGTGNGRGGANELVLTFGNGSSNGPLYLRNWNASAMDVDLNVAVSAAVWHHLAVVRAGLTLTLYVDGSPVASDDSFAITANSTPAIFGGGTTASPGSTTDRYFNGSMADLAIFSAALSASEIGRIHTAPAASLGGLSAGNLVGVSVTKQAGTVVLGGLQQNYDGNPKSATATTSPGSYDVDFTYDGFTTEPIEVGSYPVVGTINDPVHEGSASGTLVISKGTATVVLGSLAQVYDGTPKSATATTSPGDYEVVFTYGGSPNPPSNIGSYTVVATVNDLNYTGTATGTLVIADSPPTAGTTGVVTAANTAVDVDLLTLAGDLETAPAQLRFTLGNVTHGSATLKADGHTVRFIPESNYAGPATFAYTVTDTTADPRTFLNSRFQSANAADSSGNGRDGVIRIQGNGAVDFLADAPAALLPQSPQSLFLVENDSAGAARVDFAIASGELDLSTADWTCAGWFKRDSTTDTDSILQLGDSAGFGPNALSLVLPVGSSSVELRNYAGTTRDVLIAKSGIAAGAWHHFAVVRSGGTLSLYVNGVSAGSDSEFVFTLDFTKPLKLGGVSSLANSGVWDRWMNGGLADFAVFNAALTPADIVKLHTGPTANLGGQSASNMVTVDVTPAADPMANWRQYYFQTSENSGEAADGEDPDGDGLTNEREYIFGSDPTVTTGPAFLTISSLPNEITLSFVAMPAAGVGYAGMTRRYTLESCIDLSAPWLPITDYADIVGAGQTVAVTLPASGGKCFYRLKVRLE
ncbi:MAG: MBG domain-containing protein [Akkermansiaceae bacterium]